MINIDDIEKIIQVVDKFNFSHFEFEQDKSKIIIERNGAPETENNEHLKFETKSFDSKTKKTLVKKFKTLKKKLLKKNILKPLFLETFTAQRNKGKKLLLIFMMKFNVTR